MSQQQFSKTLNEHNLSLMQKVSTYNHNLMSCNLAIHDNDLCACITKDFDNNLSWGSYGNWAYVFVPDCPPFADDLLLWLDSTGISYAHELDRLRTPDFFGKLLASIADKKQLLIFTILPELSLNTPSIRKNIAPMIMFLSCPGLTIWFSWHYWNLILLRFITAFYALVMQPLRP